MGLSRQALTTFLPKFQLKAMAPGLAAASSATLVPKFNLSEHKIKHYIPKSLYSRAIFDSLDQDGDDVIDLEELVSGLHNAGLDIIDGKDKRLDSLTTWIRVSTIQLIHCH